MTIEPLRTGLARILIALIIATRLRRPPPTGHDENDDAVTTYTAAVLADAREELDRADRKAQILFASAGVAIGALLAGLLAGNWSPFELDNAVEWLWWAGVTFAAAAISCLGVTAQLILQAVAGIQGLPSWSMRRTANAEWPCLPAVER